MELGTNITSLMMVVNIALVVGLVFLAIKLIKIVFKLDKKLDDHDEK